MFRYQGSCILSIYLCIIYLYLSICVGSQGSGSSGEPSRPKRIKPIPPPLDLNARQKLLKKSGWLRSHFEIRHKMAKTELTCLLEEKIVLLCDYRHNTAFITWKKNLIFGIIHCIWLIYCLIYWWNSWKISCWIAQTFWNITEDDQFFRKDWAMYKVNILHNWLVKM